MVVREGNSRGEVNLISWHLQDFIVSWRALAQAVETWTREGVLCRNSDLG